MDTSLGQKLISLAGSLATHPTHAARYFAHLPVWSRSPIDLELPWFSYGAIDFLHRTIRPDQTVFEFGSGGSSVFFSRRAANVESVENDPNWHALVTARAKRLGLSNLRCELHAFGDVEAHRYATLPYFRAIAGRKFDVIVVDGFCGFTTAPYGILRPHCFQLALEAVQPGGMIVVDDYWMFPEFAALAPRAKLTVFEGTGPCRYGVTSSAVFQF